MSAKPAEPRSEFLLEMYRQTSSHLNRHILLSWQSIGVVGGALAVFVLGDKNEMMADARLDFAVAIVTLLCGWSIAHVYDANNWFERNLHIITNIERQFLTHQDAKDIHPYFLSHRGERSKKRLVGHLRIQLAMAISLSIILLLYHFYQRIYPGLGLTLEHLQPVRGTPYVVGAICVWYCFHIAKDRKADYQRLLRASPGKIVDASKETGTQV
jgi:hypothetical protein